MKTLPVEMMGRVARVLPLLLLVLLVALMTPLIAASFGAADIQVSQVLQVVIAQLAENDNQQ